MCFYDILHYNLILYVYYNGDKMIELLKFLLLAVVQGISEVLPISSSGHLQIVEWLLGMDTSSLTLSIFLHLGSLIALIVFYSKLILDILIRSSNYIFKKEQRNKENKNALKIIFLIIIATIPAGTIGLLFKSKIETIFSDVLFVGISLIVTGILLFISKYLKGTKSLENMSYLDALIIGLFQALGVLPGISRSGITSIGGKVRKINDEDAVNFAFLLFIPITLGTGLLEIIDVFNGKITLLESELILYVIGIIVSGIVTYIALSFLLKLIKKGKLYYFSFYCIFIGILVIVLKLIK